MNALASLCQVFGLPAHYTVLAFYTLASLAVFLILGAFIYITKLEAAKRPWLTWSILLPMFLVPLWCGVATWTVVLVFISIYGFKEFARATGLYDKKLHCVIVYAAIIAMAWCVLCKRYGLFMSVPVWSVALVMAVPVLTNQYKGCIQDSALSVIGLIYFGWFTLHLAFLADSTFGYGYVLYAVIATELNDAMAFLWGKCVGKHTWTQLSPKKTIEGSVLALVCSIGLAFLSWPIAFPQFHWWHVLVVGLLVGAGGQIGDLVMSAFKRDLGIKDFGTLLPGHGGILDRIDSLIWVAPLFFHFARYFFGGFGV